MCTCETFWYVYYNFCFCVVSTRTLQPLTFQSPSLICAQPKGVHGIVAVLRNSCEHYFTYRLDGHTAIFLGEGDLHDAEFDGHRKTIDFADNYYDPELLSGVEGHCQVFLDVYPSTLFQESFASSNLAVILSVSVAALFVLMAFIFTVYDWKVAQRNRKIVGAAERSTDLVNTLYPQDVANQLLAEQDTKKHTCQVTKKLSSNMFPDDDEDEEEDGNFKSKPIASLFPETTIFFGDLVGFTSWSSVREPTDVFTLLETLYSAFDAIAKKRKVYKVEVRT